MLCVRLFYSSYSIDPSGPSIKAGLIEILPARSSRDSALRGGGNNASGSITRYRLAPRGRDAGHGWFAQSALLSVTVMATPLGPPSLFVRLVSHTVHQLLHNPNPSSSNFRRWAVQVRATSRQRNCSTLRRACQNFGPCVDPNFRFL